MKISRTSIRLIRETTTEYNKNQIKNMIDVVKLVDDLEDIQNLDVENAFIICLNNQNEPVNYSLIAKGSINRAIIDPKTIFKNILLSNASGFIMIHNHPSGDATPSEEDFKITNILKNASKLLNIKFLDHMVIGNNSYISCMELEAK